MAFTDATFLFFFLPIVLLGYLLIPPKGRNVWLLLASLAFYALAEIRYLWLLLLTAFLQYAAARLTERFPNAKKPILVSALVLSLGFLFYYKYAAFFLSFVGLSIPTPDLPIGISFYTFQAISYTVDVYRGEVKAQRRFWLFAAYLTLFPQLVAGPIVRYADVSDELTARHETIEGFAEGACRFSIGLAKKLILADSLAYYASLFSLSHTVLAAWLAAIAFTLQIYFDFSGYSDMALGLGKIFGFSFPENFRYPYCSSSVSEFWRRWHITLSSFFKSYVYIPLGGNRRGRWRTYCNLLIVWILTGLWHGASLTFVAWGLFYALFLIFEKKTGFSLKKPFGILYTLLVTVIGFVIFSSPTLGAVWRQIGAMFFIKAPLYDSISLAAARDAVGLLLISSVLATPLFSRLFFRLSQKESRRAAVYAVLTPTLLVASLAFLVGASSHPFLYFRF